MASVIAVWHPVTVGPEHFATPEDYIKSTRQEQEEKEKQLWLEVGLPNVEKAIGNLKAADCLDPDKLHDIDVSQLAEMIRPAGYYKIKAKRLKNFLNWLSENYNGRLADMENLDTARLRAELLSVSGIGPETADSILLYAFDRPVFVVDAYTARIAVRHQLIEPGADYEQLQSLFQSLLPDDVKLFNKYHALLVNLGKQFCRTIPRCTGCPLESLPHTVDAECF